MVITDNQICKRHCRTIIEDAKEIKALLDYDDDRIIELNYTRLMANVEQIKNSIIEIELTYKKKEHSEWKVSSELALKYQKMADEIMNNTDKT